MLVTTFIIVIVALVGYALVTDILDSKPAKPVKTKQAVKPKVKPKVKPTIMKAGKKVRMEVTTDLVCKIRLDDSEKFDNVIMMMSKVNRLGLYAAILDERNKVVARKDKYLKEGNKRLADYAQQDIDKHDILLAEFYAV